MDERELLWKRWEGLTTACREYHEKHSLGAGGASMCRCGMGCGGSDACGMLNEIASFITFLPTKGLPKEWRDKVEMLRGVVG